MQKPAFAAMSAFVAVAEQASFAKAARQLGVSRSTLSTTIRGLEEKLGVRLLNRTTRSVALTEVGERLLAGLRPALESFDAAVEAINIFRDRPTEASSAHRATARLKASDRADRDEVSLGSSRCHA